MTSMTKDRDTIRVELTSEQQAQVKSATGKDADALELKELVVEELEERIAPDTYGTYWRR